jgi:PTH1 family peptidyl-tRNA hydrolase
VKLIVGLGNPGKAYEKTRHNVGFHVVQLVAEAEGWSWSGKLGKTPLAEGVVNGEKVVLAKPQTFMNLSGPAAAELVPWYKVPLDDLLVVCDDLDLPFARMRMRLRGSSGGHHGLDSVIQSLGTREFPRLKLGIGRPAVNPMQTAGYVLHLPRGKEKEQLEDAERLAAEAVRCFIRQGALAAMNTYNGATIALSGEDA